MICFNVELLFVKEMIRHDLNSVILWFYDCPWQQGTAMAIQQACRIICCQTPFRSTLKIGLQRMAQWSPVLLCLHSISWESLIVMKVRLSDSFQWVSDCQSLHTRQNEVGSLQIMWSFFISTKKYTSGGWRTPLFKILRYWKTQSWDKQGKKELSSLNCRSLFLLSLHSAQ